MRAVSPLGREVVCHIKSPFLLLLQLHSKHQDRGRDYAWQHYSQASRNIAALLPISVTVIQVQPVLYDAWYIWPWGLLKQFSVSSLHCSFYLFILPFCVHVAQLINACIFFSKGGWWLGRSRQCHQDDGLSRSELSQSERGKGRYKRSAADTETEKTVWAWVTQRSF